MQRFEQINFNISESQIEKLRPYLPNIDDLLQGDIHEFQVELNDAIVYYLDENYEHTSTSIMLEEIYDQIYIQNKSEE